MLYSQGKFDTCNVGSVMFMTDQKEPDERGYRKVNRVVIDNLVVDVLGDSKGDIILPNDIIVNAEINSVIHLASPFSRIDFIGGKHEYFSIESGTEKVDARVYFDNLFRTQIKHHFHRIYHRVKRIEENQINRSLFTDAYTGCAVLDALEIELCTKHWILSKLVEAEKEVEQLKGN